MLTVKIGGQAGWGIKSFGQWMLKIAQKQDFFGFLYPEYPSLIRGGHNTVTITFDKKPLLSSWKAIDILLALDRRTWREDGGDLRPSGRLIGWEDDIPAARGRLLFPAPWRLEISPERQNSLFLGALVFILGWPRQVGAAVLKSSLGDNFKEQDLDFYRQGYSWAKRKAGQPLALGMGKIPPGCVISSGNKAMAEGAIAAGCDYAAIYPMTPITAILHFLIGRRKRTGMVLFQPEDEIAGINAALGASYAGRRAMVATSGGGFALMNEALGMAGMSETPLVVIEGQRAGPATGMPTWTEQADLQFAVHAAPSEFPRIVLAPGDAAAAGRLTVTAFYLAEKYQLPVILLTDKFLAESWSINRPQPFPKYAWPKLIIKRGDYARYRLTPTGISRRAIPGQTLVVANSYEHNEVGQTSEDAANRRRQMAKRLAKVAGLNLNNGAQIYGPAKAEITLVGWGSSKGPVLEALKKLARVNFVHFEQVYPLPPLAKPWLEKKNLILIENNSTGQLGELLAQEWGISFFRRLLKNDGRPFFPEEIIGFLQKNGR